MAVSPHHPQHVLVTGGAGFIGLNFVHHLLRTYPDVRVTTLDLLTYAASPGDLLAIDSGERHRLIEGDVADLALVRKIMLDDAIDTVVHFAAESHVDRSIDGPAAFVHTNVLGTFALLEAAREAWLDRPASGTVRFHQVSTDEVYGALEEKDAPFTERTPYAPSSPYSATKAAADHLARAYLVTYGLPVTLTNCSNNYGPYQHAEKFIPTVIRSCLAEQEIPIYGAGRNVRDWLHVADHCRAIDLVLRRGRVGETYLVGADNEMRNIDLARRICAIMNQLRPRAGGYENLLTSVPDRLGHDFRYAIDGSKLQDQLGWKPTIAFDQGLQATVAWYLDRWSHVSPPAPPPRKRTAPINA